MIEFALHNEIKNFAKEIFGTNKLSLDTQTFYIKEPQVYIQLGKGLFFLINEHLDLPTTATLLIQSQNNILTATKDTYNNNFTLRPFRGYLNIKTINYGNSFTPFTLTFLKVMPYEPGY